MLRVDNMDTARFLYSALREGLLTDEGTKRSLRDYMSKEAPAYNLLSGLRADLEVTFCTDEVYGDEVKCYCNDTALTNEELHDYYQSGQIHSPYDCTGLRFIQGVHQFYSTYLKKWVIVERSALDV